MEHLQTKHQDAICAQKYSHDMEIGELRDEQKAYILDLQKAQENVRLVLHARITKLERDHEKEVSKMDNAHKRELEEAKSESETKISELEQQLADEVTLHEQRIREKITSLETKHAAEKNQLQEDRETSEREYRKVRSRLKQELADIIAIQEQILRDTTESLKKKHEGEKEQLRKDRDALRNALDAREGFDGMKDVDINNKFQELILEVEKLARLEWKGEITRRPPPIQMRHIFARQHLGCPPRKILL